ncbi:hypothetical protein [Aneurinibacillus sp. REN35]|uniref:hypothetical protein n=1 Tax=Aneurinibacillus sp. REN35 TaxID=3237286 RepID=UPI003527E95E
MKKWAAAIGLTVIIVGAFVLYNKSYYPPLPIENSSKREVIAKLHHSNEQIVYLANENGVDWYIINKRNIGVADEVIKELAMQNGWSFKQKEGSGLFFEKQGENLIVSTQMWTGNYVLVKIPDNF